MVAKQNNQSGFALLVAIIVVGVVLSVGLVILDLTIKQVRLAATTADSEIAFHAANAGMECARYIRRNSSSTIADGNNLTGLNCFGSGSQPSTVSASAVSLVSGSGGSANYYTYRFTWGPTDAQRCTIIDMVTVLVPAFDTAPATVSLATMRSLIEGYPGTADYDCPLGGDCTTIAVRGYNQPCPTSGTFDFGVIERKVLLEF